MLNLPEFGSGEQISFWTGETFQRAWIYDLYVDPVKQIVIYRVTYGGAESKGKFKSEITPYHIRQSQYFDKGKT